MSVFKKIRTLLLPFSGVYYLLTKTRNHLYNKGVFSSEGFNYPIISVGNITVGGTGKTPHVEYLIRLLGAKNVCVLSRGYGRSSKGFLKLSENTKPEIGGDEPMQMVSKFKGLRFYVDENRVHGVQKIIEENAPFKAILLDDAYQHRKIKPGFSVLLIDYNRPLHKDYVFPAGNLREPSSGRKRADIVVISKCPERFSMQEKTDWEKRYRLKNQALFFSSTSYKSCIHLASKQSNSLNMLSNKNVLLFTGIAEPEPLLHFMKRTAKHVQHLAFPDHHHFSDSDLKQVEATFKSLEGEKILLTTEKDATRIRPILDSYPQLSEYCYYIPIEIKILFNQEQQFNNKIITYVNSVSGNR